MSSCSTMTTYKRKALTKHLSKIFTYSLTVVEAPMGYGKTTAMKEFFKDAKEKILWQTITDDSAIVFWNGFCRLIRKLDPAGADRLAGLGVPGNSVFMEEALNIIEDIELSEIVIIVFDDYHLLESKEIDRFLELMVKLELPNLHIVILSRSAFGENTAELVLKGFCRVIAKNCFELSRDEIREYCELFGVILNTEETTFLLSYTEGWISAIYLCILGYLQDGHMERQSSLHELIDKAVYRNSSAESKEFLLNVCIFDYFSLEQAEHMWRKNGAGMVLEQLVRNNAFIKYDQASAKYSMHNIITSYLRGKFKQLGENQQKETYQAAGKWYADNRDYINAMDYFYQAADFDSLFSALEADKGNAIDNAHKERLIRYFTECPRQIKREHPWACLIYAINLFSFNEIGLFEEQCAEIAEYIDQLSEKEEPMKEQLAGELELLRSFSQYNHIQRMSEYHQKAASLLKGTSKFMDRNSSWTFGAPSVLYMFYRKSGELEQEVKDMFKAMPHYYRLTDGHGSGAENVMQAERYYHIGDFENAEIAEHKAMYAGRSQGQMSIVLCALFVELRLETMKGNLEAIVDRLLNMREVIKQRKLYSDIHTLELCEGFIYAFLNQEKKIPAWIAQGNLQDSSLHFPSYAFFNIVWGKSLLISGQYLKLIGLSTEFIGTASVFPNLLGQVYAYIYEAAAKYKLGHHKDAQAILQQALDIAAPDGLLMPFAENGEYIMDLLMNSEKSGTYPEFIRRIRDVSSVLLRRQETMKAKLESDDKKFKLTEREREIAELVANGMANNAIGKTLHIAEVTVKKILQNIYAKLNIRSRTVLTRIVVEQKIE